MSAKKNQTKAKSLLKYVRIYYLIHVFWNKKNGHITGIMSYIRYMYS